MDSRVTRKQTQCWPYQFSHWNSLPTLKPHHLMSWSKLEALDSEYRELYLDTIARSTTLVRKPFRSSHSCWDNRNTNTCQHITSCLLNHPPANRAALAKDLPTRTCAHPNTSGTDIWESLFPTLMQLKSFRSANSLLPTRQKTATIWSSNTGFYCENSYAYILYQIRTPTSNCSSSIMARISIWQAKMVIYAHLVLSPFRQELRQTGSCQCMLSSSWNQPWDRRSFPLYWSPKVSECDEATNKTNATYGLKWRCWRERSSMSRSILITTTS